MEKSENENKFFLTYTSSNYPLNNRQVEYVTNYDEEMAILIYSFFYDEFVCSRNMDIIIFSIGSPLEPPPAKKKPQTKKELNPPTHNSSKK